MLFPLQKSLFALALAFCVCIFSATTVSAVDFVVNNSNDAVDTNINDGICDSDPAPGLPQCTLRAAVQEANQQTSTDTITFAPGITSITLSSAPGFGELPINNNGALTITGPGVAGLTISGGGATRIFSVNTFVTALISDLTLSGGNGVGATASGSGGAIYAQSANLTLDTVNINVNSSTANGSAVTFVSGTNSINNSTIRGNTGGRAAVVNSTAFALIGSTLNITNSTISGNTGGTNGGISNAPVNNTGVATLNVTNSTISGNANSGITNVSSAGGLFGIGATAATTTLNYVTIANNATGVTRTSGTVNVSNSIVATNTTANVTGTINNNGNNILTGDPQLGPLQDNGGPTFTQALLVINGVPSPAIDAANPANPPATDQRGFPRPVDGNPNDLDPTARPDIGAFEAQPLAPGTPDLQPGSDTGPSQTDNRTSDTTPTFNISNTINGATVQLLRNGVIVATGTGNGDVISLTDPSFNQVGTANFSARQIVNSVQSAPSGNLAVTFDPSDRSATITVITADTPDPSEPGQEVFVGFFVGTSAPGFPSGTVAISDGTTSCVAQVFEGGCSLRLRTIGLRTLTASYSGDSAFAGSSDTEPHTVNGTVTQIPDGALVIGEFRPSGPGTISESGGSNNNGAQDEFIRVRNQSGSPVTIQSTENNSSGFAVVSSANPGAALFVIPNGTTIPANGSYLIANVSGYSLTASGQPNGVYSGDVPADGGVALFRSSVPASFTAANRLDAAGFVSAVELFREGAGLPALPSTGSVQYSLLRRANGISARDTNNNAADFFLVAPTTGGLSSYSLFQLGAPSPANTIGANPRSASDIAVTGVDPCVPIAQQSGSSLPNTERDRSVGARNPSNANLGTQEYRLRFTNNTGQPIRQLRLRFVQISTFPTTGGAADLRALSSTGQITVQARPAGASCSSPQVPITVNPTTLQAPSDSNLGGGVGSTLGVGNITLQQQLAQGASVDLRVRLGVQTAGAFRFTLVAEAVTQ